MIVGAAEFVLLFAALSAPQSVSAPRHTVSVAPSASSFDELSKAAERARAERREDEAIRLYQQALKLKPEWDDGLWNLGMLLFEKDRPGEARDLFRRLSTQVPKSGPVWAMLGLSEFETREYPRSLDHLQQSMKMGFGDNKAVRMSVFYTYSILMTRFEQYDDAIHLLLTMAASGEEEAPLVDAVGLAALRMPLLPAEIPPDRHEMIRMTGEAAFAMQTQHFADADKLFENIEAEYPNEPGVHYFHGAYLMTVRPEEGIQEMKRELEISPSHVPARIGLADEFLKEGQLDEGLGLAREAVKLDPTSAPAHMVLGEILTAKGDLPGAIQELRTASDEAPEVKRVHWDLARAYTAAGRTDEATKEKAVIQKIVQEDSAK